MFGMEENRKMSEKPYKNCTLISGESRDTAKLQKNSKSKSLKIHSKVIIFC